MNRDDLLNWRVETACINAWPSPHSLLIDGWLVRAAGGPTRRANSVNALHAGVIKDDALIDRIEGAYDRLRRPALFRITDMVSNIEAKLAARGYAAEGFSRTLYGDLDRLTLPDSAETIVESGATAPWLAARDRISGQNEADCLAYRSVIAAIMLPCGFAALRHEGEIVAIALGVIQDELLILESVMTDAKLRGTGLARQCVSGLIGWARGQGASAVALQVTADNAPARRLYDGLGIVRDLYGYHYRVKPRRGQSQKGRPVSRSPLALV